MPSPSRFETRQCRLWSFFQCALDLRGSVGFFRPGILWLSSIIFNSPLECDVIQLNVRSGSRWACLFYVHEHDRLGFGMLSVETAVLNPWAVFDCICGFSSNCDRKGQSYAVQYYLDSVEEYWEGNIHMSEPESGKGNVNTVYFVNQARENTRISCTAKCCLRWMSTRLQMFT